MGVWVILVFMYGCDVVKVVVFVLKKLFVNFVCDFGNIFVVCVNWESY